jgi:transcriptional regulator with XRE-family HTH domain
MNLDAEGRKAVGRRMKQAAEEVHMTGYEIARQIGVPHSTVYKWWNGQQSPRRANMIDYARVTRKTFGWFYGDHTEAESDQKLKGTLLRFLSEVMAGKDLGDLLEKEFGPMPEAERVLWSLHTQTMRSGLQSDFDRVVQGLTAAERQEVLAQAADYALRARGAPRQKPEAAQKETGRPAAAPARLRRSAKA